MESVRNTARKLKRHFKDVDEHFYGHSRMSSDEIFDLVYRHRKQKDPLRYYAGSSHNFEFEKSKFVYDGSEKKQSGDKPHRRFKHT